MLRYILIILQINYRITLLDLQAFPCTTVSYVEFLIATDVNTLWLSINIFSVALYAAEYSVAQSQMNRAFYSHWIVLKFYHQKDFSWMVFCSLTGRLFFLDGFQRNYHLIILICIVTMMLIIIWGKLIFFPIFIFLY